MAHSVNETKPPSGAERDLLSRLRVRTEHAFAEEEHHGLMLAAKIRTAALLVVLFWQAIDNPQTGLAYAYNLMVLGAFVALGFLQFVCARERFHMDRLKYLFVALDCMLLAVALTADNPFASVERPPAFAMHGSVFAFFFLFLMQSAFSFRQGLVLWCGLCIVLARSGMLLWVVSQPGIVTNVDLPERTAEALVEAFNDPNFVYLGHWAIEVVSGLIVASGLAVVVARSRRLMESRSLAERGRANLARYFSPNVVDRVSGSRELLSAAREQNAAVLFADIVGFTELCEREAADSVLSLLRDYHDRLGQAVFDNAGTLDKYLGDGLMATFGTPEPRPDSAQDALRCALDMVAALDDWNADRSASGARPVRVGIGVHFGPVIAGDIGNERRLEYSVIGDTVNIASRLERLTREFDSPIVASDHLVRAVAATGAAGRAMLEQFAEAGVQEIRGREAGIPVWTLNRARL